MLISQYFSALKNRLESIEKMYHHLAGEEKMELYKEVLAFRQLSDQVVEDWLQFEEKLAFVQQLFENGQETKGTGDPQLQENEVLLPRHLTFQFLQGKGYFELSMYDEAVKSFSHIIHQEPDTELARLYLAFGFLMLRRFEVAYRQFQLLAETTSYPIFASVAYNEMGVISVLEGKPDQGIAWFQKALEIFPGLSEARFNEILTLFSQHQYDEVVKKGEALLADWEEDMEFHLLYAYACAQTGKMDQVYGILQKCERLANSVQCYFPVAACYEKLGFYQDAYNLYVYMIPELKSDPAVWHGLGWTLWKSRRDEKALAYLKKALTLSPGQADYACSYAWVLLESNQVEKSYKVFKQIQETHKHPLSYSGLCHVSLIQGLHREAESFAKELLNYEDRMIQGLGHYHLGRVFLEKEDYDQALSHFHASHELANLKESKLYSGLVHFMQKENEKAMEIWGPLLT
jgi:tetratricopeptide (TPR) repeat protein